MPDSYIYALFLLFLVAEVSSLRKRWRLHLLHGEDWFFDVPVQPGFYAGPGRQIVRAHRIRLLWPYFLEILAVLAIWQFGSATQLLYLMTAMVLVIVGNHAVAVLAAQRQARRYELPGAQRPATSVVLPLETRRLRDYARPKLEILLAAANLAGLVLLYRQYTAEPPGEGFAGTFGVPALLLYLQAGAMLIKRALVAWRTVLPAEQTEAHAQWREHLRRLFLDTCDAVRVLFAGEVLVLGISTYTGSRLLVLAPTLAGLIVWLAWYARRRNVFLTLTREIRPVKLPAPLPPEGYPRGVLCYRPDYPAMLIKGPQRYSFNLGSRRTQAGLAYVAGLAGLCLWTFR